MEEINLKDLLNYYKNKLIYIFIIIAITVGCGLIYKTLLEKPKYESTTSIILTGFNQNDKTTSIDNNELTINQNLVTTYQQIVKSDKVLSKVIKELNLKCKVEDLRDNINVNALTDTEIIEINVYNTNAKVAYKITNKIAQIFTEEVKNIYNVSNVSILDEAKIAKEKSNMSMLKFLVIFTLIGIVLGIGIITICFYFDTTIKTSEQIEAKFDIPILGTIPNLEDKKSKKKRGRK